MTTTGMPAVMRSCGSLRFCCARAATDPGDIVARNGGDEFCVVFAEAEKSSAIERAERLRASIADADFRALHAPVSSGEEVRISASSGVACFPVDAQSLEALLERSDEAMNHSKETSRNGVFFCGVNSALVRGDGAAEERSADRHVNEESQRRPTKAREISFRCTDGPGSASRKQKYAVP